MRACTNLDVAVLVFAREPIPGRAKTRLIPRLGAFQAARLHARLAARAMRTATAAACGPVELHLAARQHGADLGERMYHALCGALRRHRAAILIGTDCPALRPADLRRAARLLAGGCDAVLTPAEDGGYVLIGVRRVSPRIFAGVEWGGAEVCAATAARLDSLAYRWRALRMLWDVDRPEDLERLRALRFSSTPLPRARRSRDSRARWGG